MDNDKKCECCGTINDAHHSAECIDTGGKGYKNPQAGSEAVSAELALFNAKLAKAKKVISWVDGNLNRIVKNNGKYMYTTIGGRPIYGTSLLELYGKATGI